MGPNTWTCVQCGTSAEAGDPQLLRSMGWEIDDEGRSVCTLCVKRSAGAPRPGPSRAEPTLDAPRRTSGGS